ncbi:hypothetical protein [Paenibacillus piri]|uniref:hypothetical protein n=1 Tax=Paenibacillus piri TaxID=2547395 RepID=UPI001FEBC2CE|nr:hypothetical protein [Paenibacillus piri]
MNGRRIVITGASGFTGRHACAHFAGLGFEVVAAVPLRLEIGSASAPPPEPVDSLALHRLGWVPEVPFEQSIGDILAYCREQYRAFE